MSQNNSEEISVQKVFDLLTNYFKGAYDGLLSVLHEEPNYKRLIKTGERQFFDSPNESSIDAESMKSRLCLAKTNYLAVQVDSDIDKIVREKFQGEFLDNLKGEVLKAILFLTSDQLNKSDVIHQTSASLVKSEKCDEKAAVVEVNSINNSGPDLSMVSIGSVSSVHTSDLSSFEDEISLSSNEELGANKRLSLKEVQEKLEKSHFEKMEVEEEDEQGKSIQAKDTHYDSAVNGNELSSMSQKPQRRRKPNLKYTDDDNDIMPFKKKSTEKVSSASQSVSSDMPRKRGRPKKHSIQLS